MQGESRDAVAVASLFPATARVPPSHEHPHVVLGFLFHYNLSFSSSPTHLRLEVELLSSMLSLPVCHHIDRRRRTGDGYPLATSGSSSMSKTKSEHGSKDDNAPGSSIIPLAVTLDEYILPTVQLDAW